MKPETVNETAEKAGDTTDKLEPADSEALDAPPLQQVQPASKKGKET